MEILAGKVLHVYRSISVARVQVIDVLKVSDTIHIQGHTTDFDQKIESMQRQHQSIRQAAAGDIVGIKVDDHVRKRDLIYRVKN